MKLRLILAATAAVLLAACSGGNGRSSDNDINKGTRAQSEGANSQRDGAAGEGGTKRGKTAKTVTREFPVYEDFYQVTNVGSLNIEITQGPCRVYAEGDSTLIASIVYDNDGGGVSFNLPLEENTDVNRYNLNSNVTMHVSCPEPRIIANCGGGNIRIKGSIRTSDLHIGGMGDGLIESDSIVCQTFRYEQTSNTKAQFAHIDCTEAAVMAYGRGKTEFSATVSGKTMVDVGDVGTIHGTIASPLVTVYAAGQGKTKLQLDTKELEVSAYEKCTVELDGSAVRKHYNQGRDAKLIDHLK